VGATAVEAALGGVWRLESPRIVARLSRVVKDVGLAEDLAQEALLSALEEWPRLGIPEKPGAWLMTVAKRRALNWLRHRRITREKEAAVAYEAGPGALGEGDIEAAMDLDIADDLLRLVFYCCHPSLGREARLALTLRLVAGLSTAEIARAFLSQESTIAQRIVRAKRTLSEGAVEFELPRAAELGERLASVFEVVYLIFNEGYSPSQGQSVQREELQREGVRLARLLVELCPSEPEAFGLCALLELQASRSGARLDTEGQPVLLLAQDRSLWDADAIARGLGHLERALALEPEAGWYTLQASIAACHARAEQSEQTAWPEIARLYSELHALRPSAVLELNRALAVAQAEGPAAGLALLDALVDEPELRDYPFLPSGRAELLERLGRIQEAKSEFEEAARRSQNERQRQRLLERASALG
jgi:RNA polymerase sigma factor (sigma-70 family)